MKKILVVLAAAALVLGCNKTEDLENKLDQLQSKFNFSIEVDEGPYCFGLDNTLSCKRELEIPFKINGNIEGLKFIPILEGDFENKWMFSYKIDMTTESEGVISIDRGLETYADGGEIDCYLEGAELRLMAFNADGISACKILKFEDECFLWADDECDLSTSGSSGTIETSLAAGSYELTVRHLVAVPESAKIEDMIDINDLYYISSPFNSNKVSISEFKLTKTNKFFDQYENEWRLEKDYVATITWTAASSETKTHIPVMKRTAPGEQSGTSDFNLYIHQK